MDLAEVPILGKPVVEAASPLLAAPPAAILPLPLVPAIVVELEAPEAIGCGLEDSARGLRTVAAFFSGPMVSKGGQELHRPRPCEGRRRHHGACP